MMQEGAAMRARLEAEMRSGRHKAAMQQMAVIMAGMMRGEKGAVLQAMRMQMVEHHRVEELSLIHI